MNKRMSNAPVFHALAQARFSPVAAMNRYADQIQDKLRREGYPLFELQDVTHLVVSGAVQAQAAVPQIANTPSWLITRADHSAGFILEPSSITYHTTRYDTHGTFLPEFLRGLAAVHEVAGLDHVQRLGLRYLDAVLPREGEQVEQYLAGGVHGISGTFNARQRYRLSESVFEMETGPLSPSGTLVARVYRMNALLRLPPDLPPGGLMLDPRFVLETPQEHAVIDTDHFVEGQLPVDIGGLEAQLRSLHAGIRAVFDATISRHAHNVWA